MHILKEKFNYTYQEELEQLEFNLLWHHALGLDIAETHLPQKPGLGEGAKATHRFWVPVCRHRHVGGVGANVDAYEMGVEQWRRGAALVLEWAFLGISSSCAVRILQRRGWTAQKRANTEVIF